MKCGVRCEGEWCYVSVRGECERVVRVEWKSD